MDEKDVELLDDFAELLEDHPKIEEYKELPPMSPSQGVKYNKKNNPSKQECNHAEEAIKLINKLTRKNLEHEVRKIVFNFREQHPILYMRWKSVMLARAMAMDAQSSSKLIIMNIGNE